MKYEQLTAVNDRLDKMPIGKKNYVMVNDRVQGFRELFPDGCIETEIVDYVPNEYAVVFAKIYRDDASPRPLATGIAQETVTKNKNINRTSMLENCETSAIGRALGFLGIGSVESIASADEVNKAKNKERELNELEAEMEKLRDTKISESHVNGIITMADKIGVQIPLILRQYGVKDLADMSEAQYGDCVNRLNEEAEKRK